MKNLLKMAGILLLAGMSGACSLNPLKTGSIILNFPMMQSKTLLPAISMEPVNYAVNGAGPDGAAFNATADNGQLTQENVISGLWTITVNALNDKGTVIGEGTAATVVPAGGTSQANITVVPFTGSGTLDLAVNWKTTDIEYAAIQASLIPASGAVIDLYFTITDNNMASYENNTLPAGYYSLLLQLMDNSTTSGAPILKAGAMEVVRIVHGQVTSAAFDFTRSSELKGAIRVNITPEMARPIPVTLSGQALYLDDGGAMTVRALHPDVGNVVYAWYINGEARATGASYTVSGLQTGVYRLDAAVFSADGKRGGSATHSFCVVEELPQPTPAPTPTSTPMPTPTMHRELTATSFQAIETEGAYDWKHFTIEGEHFLAVANYFNGTTRNINSRLYKWNGYNFELLQNLATYGALDWEVFSIEGAYYLAVANHYEQSGSYNINSAIYRWDNSTGIFKAYQSLPTSGAYDCEYFTIGDDHFLAVANSYNGSSHNINSRIYKWNGTTFDITNAQNIATNGAIKWKFFTIGANHFLAVANYYNDTTCDIASKIYRWNGTAFDTANPIAITTNSGYDWEHFTIGNDHFLAIANYYSNSTYNINSRIYRWDGTTFALFQVVPTNGASAWKYFTLGGDHFLAVANYFNGTTYKINSYIYKWNGVQFDINTPAAVLATTGVKDFEFFNIGDTPFLAAANCYDDNIHTLLSRIYKLKY